MGIEKAGNRMPYILYLHFLSFLFKNLYMPLQTSCTLEIPLYTIEQGVIPGGNNDERLTYTVDREIFAVSSVGGSDEN